MAEDYKIQFSPNINGELYNIRVGSVEEAKQITKELADASGEIIENLNILRQAVVADSILTTRGESRGAQTRTVDTLPPSDEFTCKHGAMKDLSDKDYKYTHYCSSKDRNNQCPPKGKK